MKTIEDAVEFLRKHPRPPQENQIQPKTIRAVLEAVAIWDLSPEEAEKIIRDICW